MSESNSKKLTHKYPILLVVVIVILLIITYLLFNQLLPKRNSLSKNSNRDEKVNNTGENGVEWLSYAKPEFSFSILYPSSLNIWETKDSSGYSFFMRFEEPVGGNGAYRGIAVGVTKSPLVEEVIRIKEEIAKEGIGKLKGESDISVDGTNGFRLDYEPSSETEGESRSIVVVSMGEYSYSISTVPEQIEKVISKFKFL